MGAPEYTEEVQVTEDDEYYAKLTDDELVSVHHFPGKGKGIVAETNFRRGDTVLTERALAACQNLDERKEGIPVCGYTLRSLETPAQQVERVCGEAPGKLPGVDSAVDGEQMCTPTPVPCRYASTGCPISYCSEQARDKAWQEHHCVLCKGAMNTQQLAAYEEYEADDWTQGGVDYSDTFHLALHIFSIVMAHVRGGQSPEEAFRPFELLIRCPWQRFTFGYLLTEGSEIDARTKEDCLGKALQLLRTIFAVGEDHPIITEYRLTRLLGCVLLNGQERTPPSPWTSYLEWLGVRDRQAKKRLKKQHSHSGLGVSARGQGIYRVGACFNHSCEPNIQVTYCADQDETLVVYALKDIQKGEELCISYIDEDAALKVRQEQLAEHYLFTCICPKCAREKAER